MLNKRTFLSGVMATGIAMTAARQVFAQAYPTRTIKIVVPFPPGGPTDVTARLVAARLQARLGQSVIVESRPGGAGGTVGAKAVAASEPDGYTLLLALTGTLTISPAIYKNSGYDTLKSFTPVAMIGTSGQVLAVTPSLPVKSLTDLVAYAKANPGKVSYASPGFGTQPHLLGELFKATTGANVVHVPYKGSAPGVTDLLAGQVQMMFDAPTILLPHVEAGRLRGIAVTGEARMARIGQVPTVAEAGFPKLQATLWSALVAPAGTPPGIVTKLNAAVNADLATDAMRTSLARFAVTPEIKSPQDCATFLAAEVKKWGEVVREADIKAP